MTLTAERRRTGLRGFLDQGGLVRWVAVVVVYLAIYLAAGWVTGQVTGHYADDDVLTSPGSVFVQLVVGLIVGALVLVAFLAYLGWTQEVFGRQPVYRSWWMWLGPIAALLPVLFRVLGIDWGRRDVDVVAMVLVAGAFIGFVEELMYRGIGVKMLRDGGHGEWAVAAATSLVFAFSHSINLFSGQAFRTVAFTWLYTFAFGVLMYLTLRTTAFLVGAMVLHALTDPTTILATGGIDEIRSDVAGNGWMDAAGLATIVVIVAGLVLLAFVRGHTGRNGLHRAEPGEVAG